MEEGVHSDSSATLWRTTHIHTNTYSCRQSSGAVRRNGGGSYSRRPHLDKVGKEHDVSDSIIRTEERTVANSPAPHGLGNYAVTVTLHIRCECTISTSINPRPLAVTPQLRLRSVSSAAIIGERIRLFAYKIKTDDEDSSGLTT